MGGSRRRRLLSWSRRRWGLAGNLAAGTVQVAWRWWPLAAWTAVVLLCIVATVVETARAAAGSAARAGGKLEEIAPILVGEVEQQWDREAVLRQLYQPVPLQVRWSSTGRPVAASRDVVLGQGADADWRQLPLQGMPTRSPPSSTSCLTASW